MQGQMSLFDFIDDPEAIKKPRVEILHPLLDHIECEKDHTKLCNRYGYASLEECKKDLPKGFACSGCCWYCLEAPQHKGKCWHECRKDKQ